MSDTYRMRFKRKGSSRVSNHVFVAGDLETLVKKVLSFLQEQAHLVPHELFKLGRRKDPEKLILPPELAALAAGS